MTGCAEVVAHFERTYLDQLLALAPSDVRRSPCFGYGRGGVAYALYRAGKETGRDDVLQRAASWVAAGIRSANAFQLRGWPKWSFSRGLAGLHAIGALVAAARGDAAARERSIAEFVRANRRARGSIDLFSGRAGRLAGTAALVRALPDDRLFELGDELASRLVRALDERSARLAPSGIAHGWPGVVLALLEWDRIVRFPDRDRVARWLAAVPDAAGAGWAHGAAGSCLLWSRAFAQLERRELLERATQAGAQTMSSCLDEASLVSGAPGSAYCVLSLAQLDARWRDWVERIVVHTLDRTPLPERDPYGTWSGLSGWFCLVKDYRGARGFPGIEDL